MLNYKKENKKTPRQLKIIWVRFKYLQVYKMLTHSHTDPICTLNFLRISQAVSEELGNIQNILYIKMLYFYAMI